MSSIDFGVPELNEGDDDDGGLVVDADSRGLRRETSVITPPDDEGLHVDVHVLHGMEIRSTSTSQGPDEDGVASDRSSSLEIEVASVASTRSPSELSLRQYFCFFVIGIGLELPYHCFLTAYDYFALFEGENAEFIVTLSFDPTCLLTFFLMLKYGDRLSEDKRMMGGFFIQLMTTLFINSLSILDLSFTWSVLITVVSMMIVGVMTAALQITAFAIGGRLPPTCLQAFMSGIGLSGLIVAGLRIINKLILPATDEGTIISAHIYFLICIAMLGCCILCYYWMRPLIAESRATTQPPLTSRIELEESGTNFVRLKEDADDKNEALSIEDQSINMSNSTVSNINAKKSESLTPITISSDVLELKDIASWKLTLVEVWQPMAIVLLTYASTFFVFPGLVSLLRSSQHPSLNQADWFTTILIALFNLANFLGSALTKPWLSFTNKANQNDSSTTTLDDINSNTQQRPGRSLWLLVILRLPIIVLLALCYKPHLIESDIAIYLLVFLLGCSNGWVGSLAVIYGPEWAAPPRRELASQIVSAGYNIGITLGTTLSFPVFAFL